MRTTVAIAASVTAMAVALTSAQTSQSTTGPVTAPIEDSYYAAGQNVEIPAPVSGDVVVAGRVINVGHAVTGDVLAAGWRVSLSAPASDDVRIAGRELMVNAPIAGDLTAAGGDVVIGTDTHVKGRTWLAGGTVHAAGVFERETHIAGGTVELGGEVRRPIKVIAETLEILPGARVLAQLTYEGPTEAKVDASATVLQPIIFRRIERKEARAARWPSGVSNVVFAAHLLVSGLLLFLVLPLLATGPAQVLGAQPARSFLAGMMLIVTVPFASLLLLITLIGIPIGLTLMAAYLVALLLGLLTTAFYIGNLEARLFNRPITNRRVQSGFFAAGVFTLVVLRSVPGFGGLAVFAATLFGLGALGLWIYRLYLQASVPAAAH